MLPAVLLVANGPLPASAQVSTCRTARSSRRSRAVVSRVRALNTTWKVGCGRALATAAAADAGLARREAVLLGAVVILAHGNPGSRRSLGEDLVALARPAHARHGDWAADAVIWTRAAPVVLELLEVRQ